MEKGINSFIIQNVHNCSGVENSSLGIMWPLREAESSPPSSAQVGAEFNYTSHLSSPLHGTDKDNLTFYSTRFFNQSRKPTLSTVCSQTDGLMDKSHIVNGVRLLTYCFPVSNSRSDNRRLPSCRSTNKSVIGGWELCEQMFILLNSNFNHKSNSTFRNYW
jgi:hypothetical protein